MWTFLVYISLSNFFINLFFLANSELITSFITLLLLQTQDLRDGQKSEPCIGLTQENSIENSVQDCLPYILIPNGLYKLFLAYSKWPCVCLKVNMCFYMLYDVILSEPSISFYVSCDVTCCITAWSCYSNPNPSSKNRIKENKSKGK